MWPGGAERGAVAQAERADGAAGGVADDFHIAGAGVPGVQIGRDFAGDGEVARGGIEGGGEGEVELCSVVGIERRRD